MEYLERINAIVSLPGGGVEGAARKASPPPCHLRLSRSAPTNIGVAVVHWFILSHGAIQTAYLPQLLTDTYIPGTTTII